MNPGMLRHKIHIKKLSTTYNDFGQSVEGYELVKTVKASIKPAIGRNYYAAEQTQTDVKIKINTRYHPEIKRDMFVFYKNVTCEIVDVINVDMKNEELALMCKEVVL